MRPEFSIRSDSVDVEQIMKQIQSRIREKRGVDYTEEEIRELANVKLEQFLDPARLRSDLLEHYRARRPGPMPAAADGSTSSDESSKPENYAFEPSTPYLSSRGLAGRVLFRLRRLLNPLLKLFINPDPILHVIVMQSAFNTGTSTRFDRMVVQLDRLAEHQSSIDALNYEVAHNLVLEMTRLGIEVKNLKMRVESIGSRLDFTDRRLRALEGVVQYKPGTGPAAEVARPSTPSQPHAHGRTVMPPRTAARPAAPVGAAARPPDPAQLNASVGPEAQADASVKGEAQRARRRRRRRSRGGSSPTPAQADGLSSGIAGSEDTTSMDPASKDTASTDTAVPVDLQQPVRATPTVDGASHDPDSTL